MARPQRHRLLQGYPAVPAMVPAVKSEGGPGRHPRGSTLVRGLDGSLEDQAYQQAVRTAAQLATPLSGLRPEEERPLARARAEAQARIAQGDRSEPPSLSVDRTRALIVGVIPHTQCVPQEEACGFCTFPHDPAHPSQRAAMVEAVIEDLHHLGRAPALSGREVQAIYLGGGTANLSSTDEISRVVRALDGLFNIRDAELTLEGVPAFFDHWLSSHLRNLARQPVATKRISLGIQTFDPGFLAAMGRQRFGDERLVKKLAARARELEVSTSGDLLYGLPGQTAAQMDLDLELALSCGLDQLCLYGLVLFEGLGTPWSKDPGRVAQMGSPAERLEHWLRLRERLLREGYRPTTVTNFEREDLVGSPRAFRYEEASFSPERTDVLGVGPLSLSHFLDLPARRGLKLLRRKDLHAPPWSGGDLWYRYDDHGLRRLHLTRTLAKGWLDPQVYQTTFGAPLADDFGPALAVLAEVGLLFEDGPLLRLSPTGAYYADAVVGLLVGEGDRAGLGLHTADLLSDRPVAGHYYGMG